MRESNKGTVSYQDFRKNDLKFPKRSWVGLTVLRAAPNASGMALGGDGSAVIDPHVEAELKALD